ncbi:MAG: ABC transporter permease [Anaerolineales bacterium]|nr:ABC transporter permease [Anaerolineales bacterium]MCB0012734.1 ABC transporter permease [Anaerolineales bacterium]MCB0017210.1 ABC transporter permease [Anaerolineales bacterium]MCB8961410.1 ABC transporter permease [Ardenticatenales bacterium]
MTATSINVPLRGRIRQSFNRNVLTWLAIGLFLFLYLPIVILIIYSFNENRFVSVWTGFSTQWYGEVFRDEAVRDALLVSLWLAFWSTVISTILGTLTAIAMERFRFWGKVTYDAILYLPIIIPDIVMALSTLLFFVLLGVSLSRYTILIAHVAFNISFVAIVVRARLADMDSALEEAAADLGANPWATFTRVTVPLLLPGIVAGALLAFTLSLDDFVITFFMAGPGSTTLPVLIFSKIRFGVSPEINAISTLMFLGSTVLVIVSLLIQRRS